MPIQALESKSSTEFTPHPPGPFMAVCCDVYAVTQDNKYYGKPKNNGELDTNKQVTKLCIAFLTSEPIEVNGTMKPRYISVWPKLTWGTPDYPSKLKTFVKGWFPTATDAHLAVLKDDLERLIGKGAYLVIEQNKVGDKVYANVTAAVTPPPGASIPMIPSDFVRHVDKEQAPAQPAPAALPSQKMPAPDLKLQSKHAPPLEAHENAMPELDKHEADIDDGGDVMPW